MCIINYCCCCFYSSLQANSIGKRRFQQKYVVHPDFVISVFESDKTMFWELSLYFILFIRIVKGFYMCIFFVYRTIFVNLVFRSD